MAQREVLAVADLIPGDIVVPEGFEVVGYPYGERNLPGTIVPFDEAGIRISRHYYSSEAQVQVLR